MENKAIQDLVDRHLLNQASPDDKMKLLHLMEADPVFAQYVKECEETFNVLQAARNRHLRNQMKSWDAGIKNQKKGKDKGLLFLFILGLLVISAWCWLTYSYSSVALAKRSFNAIEESSISIGGNKVENEEWQRSIKAFRNEEFEKAIYLFKGMPETVDSTLASHVHWNILLCQLALNGPSKEWMEALLEFSSKTPEPMRSEALKLLHILQSPVYTKLYRDVLHKSFTSVKPKII